MKLNADGALLCAGYAMAPNLLRYCGPDTKGELREYLKEEITDDGLVEKLAQFETLYPYLQAIAAANAIRDPLDRRVVEAYWVGNELLESVGTQALYKVLVECQMLPKRLPRKDLKWIWPKIDFQARLHHSFHVLNVFNKTGWRMKAETVETMDSCRISWGEILQSSKLKVQNSKLKLKTQKLIYSESRMRLVPAVKEVIVMQESLAKRLKSGDWVSVHWGIVCDKLSDQAIKRLSDYTNRSIRLANETI